MLQLDKSKDALGAILETLVELGGLDDLNLLHSSLVKHELDSILEALCEEFVAVVNLSMSQPIPEPANPAESIEERRVLPLEVGKGSGHDLLQYFKSAVESRISARQYFTLEKTPPIGRWTEVMSEDVSYEHV